MPRIQRSPMLSSALTAATVAMSSIYSTSIPVTPFSSIGTLVSVTRPVSTYPSIETLISAASPSVVTTSSSSANLAISSIYSTSTPAIAPSSIEATISTAQPVSTSSIETQAPISMAQPFPTNPSIESPFSTAHSSVVTTSVSSVDSTLSTVTTSSIYTSHTPSVSDPSTALPAGSRKLLSTTTTKRTTYAGVNLPGLDFSCDKNGACKVNGVAVPNTAAAQVQHFTSNDKLNIFRITVGWQYLTNNVIGGVLNAANFATYDKLMQSCLSTGAKCVVDVHNYVSPDSYMLYMYTVEYFPPDVGPADVANPMGL